jgi:hypothetical protein
MTKMTRQFFLGFKVLEDFGKNSSRFDDSNWMNVVSKMTQEDLKNFPCAVRLPIIKDYIKDLVVGFQKYLMKETEKDMEKARKKIRIFLIADWIMNVMFFAVVWWIFTKVF